MQDAAVIHIVTPFEPPFIPFLSYQLSMSALWENLAVAFVFVVDVIFK